MRKMNIDFRKAKFFLFFKLRRISKILRLFFLTVKNFFIRFIGAYKILSVWEKRTLLVFSTIFLIFLILLARKIYYQNTLPGPISGGKITIAEIGEQKSLNPIFAKSPQDKDVANLLFSGLFYWNENGELIPDLISKYEISSDNKTYTFYLINSEWHDGVPVTADDFIFTGSIISDPNYNGPYKGLFENVIFEKIDDLTFKIILKEPYAPFLSHLTFSVLPSHILGNVPISEMEGSDFSTSPIGNGPYVFKSSELNNKKKRINLKKFDKYPNKKRSPYISEIIFEFYPDFDKAFIAYQKGEVSFLSDIPHKYLGKAKMIKGLNLYRLTPSNYTVLFFNLSQPEIRDKLVRQAISSALNKKTIIDGAISGQAEEVNGPILPEYLGYISDIKAYPHDVEAAKGYLEKTKNYKLEYNLVTSDNEDYLKIAEIIKKQLAEIGIKINIHAFDTITLQTDYISTRKYDLLLLGENLGPDPDPYAYWHSSQIGPNKFNLSLFANQKIDKLIEEARTTNDLNLRKNNYEQFQKIIAEDVPAIFLFRPYSYFGANAIIKGTSDAKVISTDDKFFGVSKWYIKIGRMKKQESGG